ncbi:hypothetical protein C8R42DRAFT_171420 [Lentinula raphanica]|nr:hypothetical protein C8R42DRAFT_171420 [Lentinula raphanica]
MSRKVSIGFGAMLFPLVQCGFAALPRQKDREKLTGSGRCLFTGTHKCHIVKYVAKIKVNRLFSSLESNISTVSSKNDLSNRTHSRCLCGKSSSESTSI